MNLQSKLEKIVQDAQGTFGVAVKHLHTGEEAYIRGTELFQLASVFKVSVLATLFREVQEGNIRLDQRVTLSRKERVPGSGVLQELDSGANVSIKDLAMLMIIVSDNYATDKLLNFIGVEKVNRYMKQLSLNHTFIHHTTWSLLSQCVGIDALEPTEETYNEFNEKYQKGVFHKECPVLQASPENNVSTPLEINRLLEKIANKELISKEASEGMLDILKRQQLRNRIPCLLPEGVVTATKSGTIGGTVNDVGVVCLPNNAGSFAITVLSKNNPNHIEAEKLIAQLSKAAFDHFMNKS